MTPIVREYILKGLYLGLWAWLAIVQDASGLDTRFTRVLAWTGGGLLLGLLAGAIVQIRRGYKPASNAKAFPLVVLLESPFWIYLGILGGLTAGLVIEYDPPAERNWLGYCALGGVLLGYGFHQLRGVPDKLTRFLMAAAIGAVLIYLGDDYIVKLLGLDNLKGRSTFGLVILAGLPFFYLLTFCGEAEESEVEIAALCAALGIGLYEATANSDSMLPNKAILLAPLMLYFVYVTRLMPSLKVFKHTLRGFTAMNMDRPIVALTAFKRALALNPRDELAAGGLWDLHQRLDVDSLPPGSDLLDHLDYNFCLNQVATYLIGAKTPTDAERAKADRMLNLVDRHQPQLAARVDYLKAVSLTHAKQFDEAAALLSRLLDPQSPYDARVRRGVLFKGWDLATRLHPEIIKRLGLAELAKPGRRMQAIAAVERMLAAEASDATALELKALYYSELTEAEFAADAASGPPAAFNYDYVEQLGLAFVNDAAHRERGLAFLRMAGHGAPNRGPAIFAKLSEVADQLGRTDEARNYREQVKRAGQQAGVKQLSSEQRPLYFQALKRLAEDAEQRGEYDNAIGDYRLYLESGANEMEGYRKLADLYEKLKDPLNALLMTETGLVYSSTDKDFLARKDRYYYSVEVDRLAAVKDKVYRFFDVDYCAAKAKQILEAKEVEPESLDWALHLARLGRVIKPDSPGLRLAEARVLLRQGDRDAALAMLEDLHEAKGTSDEWYIGTKILADLYANEYSRPDLAVGCYIAYKDYSKSGADTLFSLAKCYEAMQQPKNALKYYEAVSAYDQHPKYWDAKEAINRLKGE